MKNLILNKNVKFSTTAVVVLTGVCVLMSIFAIINVVNAGNFEVSVTETGGRRACESMPPFSDTGSNYFTYTVSVVNNSSEGYRIAIAAFHSDKAGCGAFDGAIGGGWEIVSGKQNYLPGESGTLVLRYKVDTYGCGRIQYDASYRPFGADMSESTVFIADVVNYGKDCNYDPPVINNPIGYLDAANCNYVGGWAKDLDVINSIDVDLYLDGNFLIRTTANKYRADVGNYAFHYDFTDQDKTKINDGNTHAIKAVAINIGGGINVELIGSPKTFGPCTIPVSAPTCSITANPSSITEGNYSTLSWTSNNATSCYASNAWYGSKSLSGSQSVSPTNDSTYVLTCSGAGGSVSCSTVVDVTTPEIPTLSCSLEADPDSGTAPLNGVDLTASVGGTATGTINYKFDCNNDGIWDHIFNNINNNPKTVADACNYPSAGTYTAKAMVERSTANSAQCYATINVNPVVTPQPTCSITANPSSITEGNYSTLSWTSNNATSCYASNAWYGSKSLSGSQSVSPTNDSTYTLVCSNGYNSTTCSATVDVNTVHNAPSCSIYASPSSITEGNYSTLSWTSNNATSCYASNAWYGSKSLSGSQSVSPTNDSTYTLVCSNGYNSTTCSATIDVNTVYNTPSCSIYASPSSITEGNYSTLSWTSNNATSCYASNAWYGSKSLSGSQSVSPTNDSTYTLVCSNGYNSTTCSATVDVNTVHNAPSLRIEKLVRNATNSNPNFYETVSADLGDELEFLVRVYSIGTGSAYNVKVRDLLPSGLIYVAGSTTVDGSYKTDGIADGWISVGDIAQGSSKELKFKAKVSSTVPGVSGNYATINVANQNIETSNDVSITTIGRNITRNSNWGNSFQAYYGDEAELSVQIINNTSRSLTNVTVKETIPSNLSLVKYSTTVDGMNWGGDVTGAGLNLGTLTPGQSKTIKFKVIVIEQTSGTGGSVTLTNTAYTTADNISQIYDTASIMVGAGEVLGAVTVATGMNLFGLIFLGVISCLIAIVVYCQVREHKLSEYLSKEDGNKFIKWLINLYFTIKLRVKLATLRFKQSYF